MGDLVPNLPQLMSRLDEGSDARATAAAFDADTIEAARASLERLLEEWETRPSSAGIAGDEPAQ